MKTNNKHVENKHPVVSAESSMQQIDRVKSRKEVFLVAHKELGIENPPRTASTINLFQRSSIRYNQHLASKRPGRRWARDTRSNASLRHLNVVPHARPHAHSLAILPLFLLQVRIINHGSHKPPTSIRVPLIETDLTYS